MDQEQTATEGDLATARKSTRKVTFEEDSLQQQQQQQQQQLQSSASGHEEIEDQQLPEQSPHTNMRKYTNVTFPRGFSPSQCSLLASRQRSTNYLCFSANELGELLANQKTKTPVDKKTKRMKKKKGKCAKPQVSQKAHVGHCDDSSNSNHVTSHRHPGQGKDELWVTYGNTRLHAGKNNTDPSTYVNTELYRDSKPVLPVSNKLDRTTSGRFCLANLEDNLSTSNSRVNSGQTGLTGSKCSSAITSQTGQARWNSNREIAETLSAHIHSVLKIPPSDILREVERVERAINFSKSKRGILPQSPVYLFSQKPST